MQDVRHNLLLSALHQVHEHGWTQDAIAAAVAADSTISISLAGMIQPDELIAFSMDHWNAKLAVDLAVKQEIWRACEFVTELELDEPQVSVASSTVASRIEEAIKTRLGYLLPHLRSQRWHEGMAMGVRDPAAALHTKEQLRQLIQIISNAVVMDVDDETTTTADKNDGNDMSSNSNNSNSNNNNIPLSDWQQLTLGGVYVTTELHLLTDQSPDYQDTWEFLHERVSEWERLFVTKNNGGPDNSASAFLFMNMNPTALLQQGGNVAYTASAVASSLAGGVVSLLQPNVMLSKAASTLNTNSVGSSVPDLMWNALLKVPPPPFTSTGGGSRAASDSTGSTSGTALDGTDPRHYDSKPR
jgi:ubiquinone biosynthesis protein COQ9